MATRARRSPQAVPAPVVLGRYRLQSRLGAGAFGTVWRARDERLERDVAIKILPRERIVDGRFEREARVAARLSHPAIVTLYEAAVDDEGAYLVSELVAGATLDRLLGEGRLSDHDILAIGIALGDALGHAHAHGVVHRDVKPSNVLVPEAPAAPAQVAKLTDFGVARLAGAGALTQEGDVIGTLHYMAPEQAAGRAAGVEADLYSLAIVLYEALTGVPPRAGARPAPLRRQRRDLPAELGEGIDRALHPEPGRRGRVSDLRAALAACLGDVGDEPGIVAAPTRLLTFWRPRHEEEEQAATAWRPLPPGEAEPEPVTARRPLRPGETEPEPGAAPRLPWLGRAAAAAAAAATTAWLSARIVAPSPVSPATAGLIAGAAVLIAPRAAWLLVTAVVVAGALVQGHADAALVAGAALMVPVALLPRRPTLWPLAAGAPALGLLPLAGLAGAWPALAGRARTPYRRAVLGAAGWGWVIAASRLDARAIYLDGPWAAGPPTRVLTSGVLAPAAVWAAAAVVLPWLTGRRSSGLAGRRSPERAGRRWLWFAGPAAVGWAILTLLAIPPVEAAAAGVAGPAGLPRGAVVGAALAAVLALAGAITTWERRLSGGG